MPATAADPISASGPLSQWLRLLWDRAPPLRFESAAPYIAAGEIHLPARPHWRHHAAAAAHATAHLVYSPKSFDAAGLGPIARVLMAVLEDARVEALAMRELPGLARIWRPLHTATPELGAGFEALLQRLARALADPSYDDPDPWVRKGRALFFLDEEGGLLALRTTAEIRLAATRLGHDVGQMRLPFNAKTHCPAPAYRDDHRWMWTADAVEEAAPPPAALDAAGARSCVDPRPAGDAGAATWHPEWDRLIERLRPRWCRVVEQASPSVGAAVASVPDDPAVRELARRVRAPLRAMGRQALARHREEEGDVLDPDALVDWRVARRLRLPADARVYQAAVRQPSEAAVWILVDQSASSAAVHRPGGPPLLRTATRAASALALALQSLGVSCAVAGFASNGRHAVRLRRVMSFDDAVDRTVLARLESLRPGGSTRLGAVLRHVAGRLVERGAGRRWVILLSDGEPHDIDIHDPRYLAEDARHAVLGAEKAGVRMACLVLAAGSPGEAGRIFGRRRVRALRDLESLPRLLVGLLS